MTNYENDIMDLLHGDTPKQKYENLKKLLKQQQHVDGLIFLIETHLEELHPIIHSGSFIALKKQKCILCGGDGQSIVVASIGGIRVNKCECGAE